MIAELHYTLLGKPKVERFDFGNLAIYPDAAGIEYRFHHRMQLKKTYKCFESEIRETKYETRFNPEDYTLDKMILRGNDTGIKVYEGNELSYRTTPTVVRKQRTKTQEQPELNL